MYDQRIKRKKMEIQNIKFRSAKGEENLRNELVFIETENTMQERAGPLNSWPVPLILRGPPLIIKGAAQLKRPESLSFSGESLFGEKLTDFG